MSHKVLTLVIIHQDGKVLLGLKKRGFGMGKYNGFGGKVQEGESIEDAAKRELLEECCIVAPSIDKKGILHFTWQNSKDVLEVHVFGATEFSGSPEETEEMKPKWFAVDTIPFDSMWPDDQYWFPLFLAGKKFHGNFLFDKNNSIITYQLHEGNTH